MTAQYLPLDIAPERHVAWSYLKFPTLGRENERLYWTFDMSNKNKSTSSLDLKNYTVK